MLNYFISMQMYIFDAFDILQWLLFMATCMPYIHGMKSASQTKLLNILAMKAANKGHCFRMFQA